MGSVGKNAVWQDREIRFDVKLKDLNLRKGEFEIDHLKGVEDTKGNTGDKGEPRGDQPADDMGVEQEEEHQPQHRVRRHGFHQHAHRPRRGSGVRPSRCTS